MKTQTATPRQKTSVSPEVTKTFVEVLYPGSFYPEESVFVVSRREPGKIAKKYPRSFCLQFFDLTSAKVKVDGVERTVSGERKNISPKYFPDGTVMTVEDLRKLDGDYTILISNMECNNWPKVVRTRCGNFQPFDSKCKLLKLNGNAKGEAS